jgi:hypothetical protein
LTYCLQPDETLQELVDEFDLSISVSALCRKIKKTLFPSAQKREDIIAERGKWQNEQADLDVNVLRAHWTEICLPDIRLQNVKLLYITLEFKKQHYARRDLFHKGLNGIR